MNKKHAKSSCCRTKIYRFGKRRRQCSNCQKTWSIRKKKRGRKTIRVALNTHTLAFASQESLRHKAKRLNKGREKIRRRHAFKMNSLLKKLSPPVIPGGSLIAIIDGYQLFFNKQPWTLYLILLRPVNLPKATVTEPCFIKGPETVRGWEKAFAELPSGVEERIQAVVSDGMLGLNRMTKSRKWIMQRCHLHLTRILYCLLGRRFKKVKLKGFREQAYQNVLTILNSSDKFEVQNSIASLRLAAYSEKCPKRFGLKIRGFLQNCHAFRSYQIYPELNLPATTNTAEMVCSKIAELVHRTRSFRNPESFEKWVKIQIRLLQEVQCNGKIFNRINVS